MKKKKKQKAKKQEKKVKEDKQKEKSKKDKKQELTPQEQRYNRYFKIIVLIMFILIVIVLGFSYYMNSITNFEYHGFEFERVDQGKESYYLTQIKTQVKNFGLIFMNDPRRIEYIPINATIIIDRREKMYVSIEPNMSVCGSDSPALFNLGRLFTAMGLEIEMASLNQTYAQEHNMPYKICDNLEGMEAVILIQTADTTAINQIGEDCYILNVNADNCDMQRAIERFSMGIITHSQGNYIK